MNGALGPFPGQEKTKIKNQTKGARKQKIYKAPTPIPAHPLLCCPEEAGPEPADVGPASDFGLL